MLVLIGGLHGLGSVRILHWIFNDNAFVGWVIVAALILYAIYRYMNRR